MFDDYLHQIPPFIIQSDTSLYDEYIVILNAQASEAAKASATEAAEASASTIAKASASASAIASASAMVDAINATGLMTSEASAVFISDTTSLVDQVITSGLVFVEPDPETIEPLIDLGDCISYSIHARTTATCAGAPSCNIIGGELGVSPGTSITGNFAETLAVENGATDAGCAADNLAAFAAGNAMSGAINMVAEMGGLTFTPGVYTHGSALNIALANPTVTLDAQGDLYAYFIFVAGSTLTTCANSNIVLINGAIAENVFWILGTALTMGADSTLVGSVLTGTAITIGTNGKICGRALAQSAVTCETECTVSTLASCWGGTDDTGETTNSVAVSAAGSGSATARSVAIGTATATGQVTFTISATATASARETSTGSATALVDVLSDYDDTVIPDDGTSGAGATKESVLLSSSAIGTATGSASATATATLTFYVAASASATATAIAVATAAATATGGGSGTGTDSGIALGNCEVYAAHAGTTATCAGAPACDVVGSIGVYPGTSITGNFVGTITSTAAVNIGCAADGLVAWTLGRLMTGTAIVAEMGGVTFAPGVYTHASAINIALDNPTVTLDAQGDANAVFIFNVGTTLTTCANSEIVLLNGAVSGNVYWVLGTALAMGADSILAGTVLTGTAITVGTNGKICGRAIAQSAITCETNGDFDLTC